MFATILSKASCFVENNNDKNAMIPWRGIIVLNIAILFDKCL